MNIDTLEQQARDAINDGTHMVLVLPKPWRNRPKGFPRGVPLDEMQGRGVYSYNPKKIMQWVMSVKTHIKEQNS